MPPLEIRPKYRRTEAPPQAHRKSPAHPKASGRRGPNTSLSSQLGHVGKEATAWTQHPDLALPRYSVDTSANRQDTSPGSGTQSPIRYAASMVLGMTSARPASAPPSNAWAQSAGQRRPAITPTWQAGSWTFAKACQLARGPKNGPWPLLGSNLSVQT